MSLRNSWTLWFSRREIVPRVAPTERSMDCPLLLLFAYRAVTKAMVAAAFWGIKINRTWDTWVGTELNTRLGRDILHRIPSNEKRRCQQVSLSSGPVPSARLHESATATAPPSPLVTPHS